MAASLHADQSKMFPATVVGRNRELGALRDHLAAALAGRGGLVLVGGEAGIGKTTLMHVLSAEAAARGARVLTGHCYDGVATPPYGPWRDLAASSRAAEAPAGLVDDAGVPDAGDQIAFFNQMREFFTTLAATRPLVVVLEDLHWADLASLDLLRFVGRRVSDHPLLIAATYRADELTRGHPLSAVVPALIREANATRVEPRRLTEGDVRALVAARYPLAAQDADRLVAYLQAHAEGTPFYLGELLRSLDEEGVLAREGDGWTLGDLSGTLVPPLLRQVIDGRVARLGEDHRDLLAVAAVIGQEVPLGLWSEVGGVTEEALFTVLDRAVEARLLEARADGTGVRFAHALIREALYEGILPPRRRAWHRRVGDHLAAAPDADPDAVASHLQRAGDTRAAAWLIRAGERAQRAYAWKTGADRFDAALGLLARDPSRTVERGWLRYRLGRLRRYSDPVRGIADLEDAERLAASAGDPVLAAYALADRGLLRCFVADVRRGLAEMADGCDALDLIAGERACADPVIATWVADVLSESDPAQTPPSQVNPRRGTLVMWLAYAGRNTEAQVMGEDHVAQVATVTRPEPDLLSSVADAHHGLGVVHSQNGHPALARTVFTRAATGHRTIGHRFMVVADACQDLIGVHLPYHTADLAERRRLRSEIDAGWARSSGALAHEGPPHLAVFGHLLDLLLLEGVWTGPRALMDEARAHPAVQPLQYVVGILARLAYHRGESALARTLIREELPDGPATEPGGNQFRQGVLLQRVAAHLALDAGDLAAAEAWIAAHDRWLEWSGAVLGRVDGRLLWARYHQQAGHTETARQNAAAALALARDPRQPLALLAAHRLRGELARGAGGHTDAEHHLAEALALADACAAPFERALTLLALADLRADQGRTDDARALLDEVRALCLPLAAAPTLARADALAARLSAPRPSAPTLPAGLSRREMEVLRLVADGLTDQEVADRLSISRRTVGQHLRSIYTKLNVPSRTAATRFAVEHDLL